MKLIKCYIENFGKLHNFSYNFQDGLNIIKEENGFGKTTFATFIKSMFYGLDNSTKVKVEKSDRKKYFPWQGGAYGGNIEFEINNKVYRIERFFEKRAAEDTFKLYNLETNLESNDYTENIGEEIFKINKSAYEKSTYIPQGQIQIEMEDSLSAKLGNVLENENDINTSEEAIKKLIETKKIYKKDKGKGGLIDEKKDKLFELQRKLENSKSDIETLEARKTQFDAKIKEIKHIEELRDQQQQILAKKLDQDRRIAKQETYKTILSKYKQAQEKINELNNFFESGIIEKFDINNLPEEIDENIKNCYKTLEIDKEIQIKQNERETEQRQIKKSKKIYRIILILGFILFVLGMTLIATKLQDIFGIVLVIIATIVICSDFVVSHKNKNTKLADINKKIKELVEKKEGIENQISNLLEKYNLGEQDKIMALTNLKTEYNSYNDLLKLKKNEYDATLKQYEYAQKEKENFENQNDIQELQNIEETSNIPEQELKEEIEKLNLQIDNLVDAKNQIKNQIEFLENKIDENEYLESDIENLKEEIDNSTEKYKILQTTEHLLKSAKETFSSSYLQDMVKGFNKYLSIINTQEMSTNVDIKLDVKLDVNGSQKEIKYFSAGYKDLIYICMRFSLINALFKDETPFVVLDDPLVNLDEDKTSKALKVINEFAKEYQIIYFVCNSSRVL